MSDAAVRQTIAIATPGPVRVLPPATRFVFRGDRSAQAAAGAAFGVAFAVEACRAASGGARAALWLGPDEYLLISDDDDAAALAAELGHGLADLPHSLVDVSHRQVALEMSGPRAEWLLEAQCPLPLNLRDFPVGMCTRTVFSKAEIVLWRQAPELFRLEVWRSFSRYVAELLGEVARELPAQST